MKTKSYIRALDSAGRIVLPSDLRRQLDIRHGTLLAISLEDEKLTIERHSDQCVLCGAIRQLVEFNKTKICKDCMSQIAQLSQSSSS